MIFKPVQAGLSQGDLRHFPTSMRLFTGELEQQLEVGEAEHSGEIETEAHPSRVRCKCPSTVSLLFLLGGPRGGLSLFVATQNRLETGKSRSYVYLS